LGTYSLPTPGVARQTGREGARGKGRARGREGQRERRERERRERREEKVGGRETEDGNRER